MPRRRQNAGFLGLLGGLGAALILAQAGHWSGARAAAGPWLDQEQASLRLLAAGRTAGVGETLSLGLQFALQTGWKIYWRSPGDAGYPPAIDWSGSENISAAETRWPVPHRFSLFGLETFGYSDGVVLPVDARLTRPGEAVHLRAQVDYLICAEICIPRQATLALDLPAGTPEATPEEALIERYRALVPGDGTAVGLALQEAYLMGDAAQPILQIVARSQTVFQAPDVLVEAPPGFSFGRPDVNLRDGGKTAVVRLPVVGAPAQRVLDNLSLTLTVTDGQRGMEREAVVGFAGASGGARYSWTTLASILGLAMLGGLILNLMPCVLPVLSLKLLAVAKQGGRRRAEIRTGFLASAAGIMVSFLLLAAAAIALQALGLRIGWGIQFQQPLFLAAMALVVTLFAYNLFGIFDITLPRWAADLGMSGAATAAGDGAGARLGGHFLSGAFATLLATPCSAPFLGTALGFALARGPAEIAMIFAALGLGLALPYLLVAASPALVSRLPRPGSWMVPLRRILGLALAGTALWLLTVLTVQVGLAAAAGVGALLLGLGLVLWRGRADGRRQLATPILAGLLALAAVALPAGFAARVDPLETIATSRQAPHATGVWQPFAPARIAGLVAQGKTVFVDITADWCITCRVNKALVLDTEAVNGRLAADDVVAMRGDWTLPNDEISRYLERFGRYGIPFDAVYGPGVPAGAALPELLSVQAVLQALDRADGG